MAADINIINAALSKLGALRLTSIDDVSPAGRLANSTYADIRDALLAEFPWNFATTRASLTALSTAPDWGFAYAYPLPAGCLRLITVDNDNEEEWRIELGKVVTDISGPLLIRYIVNVSVNEMDATFRECLAARLAMEWAEPLTQTTSVLNAMQFLYRNKLQVARVADGQQDQIQIIESDDFITARG